MIQSAIVPCRHSALVRSRTGRVARRHCHNAGGGDELMPRWVRWNGTYSASVRVTIRGENLPGRVTGSYREVHVALQVRQEFADPVPGDAPSAEWETVLTPVRSAGELDFRGPAVHGRRGDRFI